jgi:hypothetical protein
MGWLKKYQKGGSVKRLGTKAKNALYDYEAMTNTWLGDPQGKARKDAENKSGDGDEEIDNIRHASAGRYTAEAIANKTGNIPYVSKPLGVIGANIMGLGHEIGTYVTDPRWTDKNWKVSNFDKAKVISRELLEDAYNNFAGSVIGATDMTPEQKTARIKYLSQNYMIPDGYGLLHPYGDNPTFVDPYSKKKYGGYSTTGYKANSPDKDNPYNIIPSGRITMQNVPHPVLGIDNLGNRQMMMPGGEYQFQGNEVFEMPVMKDGGGVPPFITSDIDEYNYRKARQLDSNYLNKNLRSYFNKNAQKFHNEHTVPWDPYASKLNPFGPKTYSKEELNKMTDVYETAKEKNKDELLKNISRNLQIKNINKFIDVDNYINSHAYKQYYPQEDFIQDERAIGHLSVPQKNPYSGIWSNAYFSHPYQIAEDFPAATQEVIFDSKAPKSTGNKKAVKKLVPTVPTEKVSVSQIPVADMQQFPILQSAQQYANYAQVPVSPYSVNVHKWDPMLLGRQDEVKDFMTQEQLEAWKRASRAHALGTGRYETGINQQPSQDGTISFSPQMKEGGIPERYKNMGFTHVGQKKAGDGQHKWKVLAKKGDSYKVVQGGYRGMQDFKQHGSEERRDRFWDRMGGKNSSKAKDPFSPLYWHKRFGTWEYGGPVEMQNGGDARTASDNTYVQEPFIPASLPRASYNGPVMREASYISPAYRNQLEREYNWKHTKQNVVKPLLQGADIVTDVMQVGNFIPHPIAQAVGKVGNVLGTGVDALQAGMDLGDGNYGSAAVNAGSMLVPFYLGHKGYRRDMYNTEPRSIADKIASKGTRDGNYLHLTQLSRLKNNPVTQKGINFNRSVLGALVAETAADTKEQGGMIKRADGSYSQRGLWDNIRANAGSGKKPTKEMLQQEKKIKAAEKKEYGGWLDQYQFGGGMYMPTTSGSSPFMPASNGMSVVQQAPSFLTGVPEGIDLNTKLGYMQYLQDSIGNESRKRIIDKPYNQKDPTIILNTGNFRNAKVNTKVIDDAIASAKKKGIPLWQMIGMAGQETTLGTNRKERNSGYERPNTQRNIVSGWNTTEPVLPEDFQVYMAGHGVPGVKAIRTDKRYIGTVTDPDAAERYLQEHPRVIDSYRKSQSLKIPKKAMSEFDYAASFLKEKGIKNYNPEEKNYSSEVNKRIKELSSDPVFMNYVKQKGYNLGEARQYQKGGWLNQYQDGGNWTPNQQASISQMPIQGISASSSPYYQTRTVTPLTYQQEFLKRMQENQGDPVIREAAPRRSAAEKIGAIARNPVTAAQYALQGQPIPDYFEKGARNPYDYATDVLNPMTYVDAAKRTATLEHLRNMKGLQDLPGAAFHTAMDAGALIGLGSELRARPNILPVESPTAYQAGELVKNVDNLKDLQAAKKFAKKYGYKLPSNLKRIAQSDELTNRTIRGLMDRHNTFVRGVSTNWEEIAKKNPYILDYLKEKGFDLSTKEGTKAAAEYMSTTIPNRTSYGRYGLKEGEDALYLSNSIPTAEGYTYGEGYVSKVKRPTDFSSSNRQDWITANDFDAHLNFENSPYGTGIVKNDYIKRFPTNARELLAATGDPNKMEKILNIIKGKEELYNDLAYESWKKYNNLISDLKYNTDAKYRLNILSDEPFVRDVPNLLDKAKLKYLEGKQGLAQLRYNLLPRIDLAKELLGDKDIYKALGRNLIGKVDPFSHYAIKGKPGDKVLELVQSKKITPEIWENTSRGHINKYSDKLSRKEYGGWLKKYK